MRKLKLTREQWDGIIRAALAGFAINDIAKDLDYSSQLVKTRMRMLITGGVLIRTGNCNYILGSVPFIGWWRASAEGTKTVEIHAPQAATEQHEESQAVVPVAMSKKVISTVYEIQGVDYVMIEGQLIKLP